MSRELQSMPWAHGFQLPGAPPGRAPAVVLPIGIGSSQRRRALLSYRDEDTVSNPYYRWFSKDYKADPLVQAMTDDQDLAYRRLLDASWEIGPLPNDTDRLSALVGFKTDGAKRFAAAWVWPLTECWHKPRGKKTLINFRLEDERDGMLDRSEKARGAAQRRWKTQRKRMGIKDKPGNADAMRTQCPGDANHNHSREPEPEPKTPKKVPSSPATPELLSKVKAKTSSTSELAPNPFRFICYWEDATETRDFRVKPDSPDRFGDFVVAEAESLGLTMNRADLARFAQRSIVKFTATYSKRGSNGKTRGSRIGPKRLTEELVGWIRSDLASVGQRQTASKPNTRAQRIDDQTRRLMGK